MSPDCPEQLLIALEPEAASIYCRKLRLHQVIDLSLQSITNGLDMEGTRPFDSSFRQGIEERERECLLVDFVISIGKKPHFVPGNVVVSFHLGIVFFLQRLSCVCVCGKKEGALRVKS